MIAVSERVRRDVMETLGLPAARVRVIYNGVELERFRSARARRQTVRAEWGAAPGDVVFVFAARLVEQKRCRDFLDAFRQLQIRPNGKRLRAWILGDGPLRGELQRQAATLPSPEAVRLIGQRDDVEDFFAAADLFVLPSTKEGFSNALIEAMASGLPVIASDVGGNAEAVRNGTEGLIVPPLAVPQLTEAMGLLAGNADERRMMGDAAAQRAEAFGIDSMIADLERLYSEYGTDL
jgi:glycosyltransferase involved in cell wall biosynthesis